MTVNVSPTMFAQVPVKVGVVIFVIRVFTVGLFKPVTVALRPNAFIAVAVIFAYFESPSNGTTPVSGVSVAVFTLQVPPD